MLLSDSSDSSASSEEQNRYGGHSGELVLEEEDAGASSFLKWLLRGGCFTRSSAAATDAEVDPEARELARIRKFHPEIYDALELLQSLPRHLPARVTWFECPYRENGVTTVTLLNSGVDAHRVAVDVLIRIAKELPALYQIAYAMYWGLSVVRGSDTEFSSLVDALVPVLRQRGLQIKIDDRDTLPPSFATLVAQFPELKLYRCVRTIAVRQVRDGSGDLQRVASEQPAPSFVLLFRETTAVMFAITPDGRYVVFDVGCARAVERDGASTPDYNLPVPRDHAIRDPSATSFQSAEEAIEFLVSLFDKDPGAASDSATLVWTLSAHGTTALLEAPSVAPRSESPTTPRSLKHTMRALEGRGI